MANGRSYVTSFLTKYNNSAISQFQSQLKDLKKEMSDNKREQKELSKEIRDAQKEYNLIQKQIKQTGQATEEQKKRLDELTNSIDTDKEALERLKVQQAAIQSRINDTNAAIEKQNKAYGEMVKSMGDAKAAGADLAKQIAAITAAATAAVAGLFAFTSEAALWADDVNTLAAVTGIGTSELQKFMYASDLIDVSVETLSGSLTKLTRSMSAASENADSNAAQAFRELGISITDSTGALRDRQEVFYEVIDALGKVGNETERDALAMDVFGRSAQELNPLIKGGADALKEIGDEAERAGLILSQDALDGLNAFNDKLDLLKSKGTAIKHLAASEMTPALDGLLEVADELLDEINKMVQSGELKKFAKELGEGIKNAANALKNVIKFVLEYKGAIGAAVAAMVAFKAAMSITSLINSLITGFKALSVATKAETADMAALNATMAANPIGLVISLVSALAVGFGTLAASTLNASSEASKYTQELKELIAAENSTLASAQGEAAVLREQYDELQRLGSQTELTSGQKERLASLEETIAGRLGITTQELKDQTGAYRDLSKEIDEYIESMMRKTQYEYYENIIKSATTALEGLKPKIDEIKEYLGDAWDESILDPTEDFFLSSAFLTLNWIDESFIVEWINAREAINNARKAIEDIGKSGEKVGGIFKSFSGIIKNSGENVVDYAKAIEEAKNKLEDLEKKQKTFQSTSISLRSEMNSLANSLKQLEQGEALNLNTVLELIDKYPEYAGELLAAGDNADHQRQALENLFEAKKADYILTQQSAIDNIEASNNVTKTVLENVEKRIRAYSALGGVVGAVGNALKSPFETITDSVSGAVLNAQKALYEAQIAANNESIEAARRKIELISGLDYSSFTSGGTAKTTTGGSTGSAAGARTDKSVWSMNSRGVYASGSTYVDAYLQWIDRTLSLGRMTEAEEEKLLAQLLEREENTAEERYQVEQRLYKLREQLAKEAAAAEAEAAKQREEAEKEAAEKAAAAEKEAQERLIEGQNRALAALRRLVNSKKEMYDEEAKAAQEAADKEVAALDKEAEARKRDNDDRKRQQELDRINAKLQYSKLSSFERAELERRRQDILNEQAEVNYERSVEAQKEAIRAGADETVNASEAAKAALDAKYTTISDRVAYLNGTETLDQWAARQPASVALTYVINGLSADQVVAKTRKDIMKELGGVT